MTSPQFSAEGAVVVGVDGSRNSIAALRRADRQACGRLAALEIVYVIRADAGAAEAADARDMLRRSIEAALLDSPRVLAGRRRIERGDPAAVLVHLSRGAGLLVIGSRAGAWHVLTGPTVSHCLDYAFCQVDICADHAAHAS